MWFNRSYPRQRQVPGPRGFKLLGHLLAGRRDLLTTLQQCQRDYGDLLRFSLGPKTVYVACHPDMAEQILIRDLETFGSLSQQAKPVGLALILGNGLLQSYGEDWKRQRQMLQPLFHKRRVEKMATHMTTAGEQLLQRWHSTYSSGEEIDVLEEMVRVTLDIICRTLFSVDVTTHLDTLQTVLPILIEHAATSLKNPLLPPLNWPTPRNRRFKQALQTLDDIIYRLIQQRQIESEPNDDLLELLLQTRDEISGETMNRQQVRDQVATLLGVGHETTAAAMTWLWYALDQHPLVLQRVQDELATVLAERSPTLEDLPQLTYTRQVVNEVLRHYPPAPLVARLVLRDTEINGYPILAGSTIFVSFYHIHHHPDFWIKPEQFWPERFAAREESVKHRCAYLPFGVGPRFCLGNHFALLEMSLLLAQIAQRYTLKLVPNYLVEREVTMTMRPCHGLPMRLYPR